MLILSLILTLGLSPAELAQFRLPLNDRNEVEIAELVDVLAKVNGLSLEKSRVSLKLPLAGLGGPLTKKLLTETLGLDASPEVEQHALILKIPDERLRVEHRPDWEKRLRSLIDRAEREAKRREDYGMHALKSYSPNDPKKPTICLVHGLNSTSSVFWHMIKPLEQAGYGLVVYDFPYNRDLDESAAIFKRDWIEFRKAWNDKAKWGIVAHSMGTLLARSYVEDDQVYGNDVSSFILIAPVNNGSQLSQAQTLLQLIQGLKAVNSGRTDRGDALAHLGDGLGAAALDMTPGSTFLKTLNAKPRRAGLPYHILAGDGGFLTPLARNQIETQLGLNGRPALFGGLARLAAKQLPAQLDEIGQGTGDGAISVESTKLSGVQDHTVLHVNHLELIRAPLLFPDQGPVVCLPYLFDWLKKDLPVPSK
jgi:pimeloyl-ACP methyl ester carboxylesterase